MTGAILISVLLVGQVSDSYYDLKRGQWVSKNMEWDAKKGHYVEKAIKVHVKPGESVFPTSPGEVPPNIMPQQDAPAVVVDDKKEREAALKAERQARARQAALERRQRMANYDYSQHPWVQAQNNMAALQGMVQAAAWNRMLYPQPYNYNYYNNFYSNPLPSFYNGYLIEPVNVCGPRGCRTLYYQLSPIGP